MDENQGQYRKRVFLSSDSLYPRKITNITNGLDIQTNITYKPLTDASVYTKGSGANYPERDFQGPMYVVSQVTSDNGIGGSLSSSYQYEGMKVHLRGRGNLGFAKMTVTDDQTGIKTISHYLQDYPYTGQPYFTETRRADNQLLSQHHAYYNNQPGYSCSSVNLPLTCQSIEKNYDFNSGQLLTTVTTTSYASNDPSYVNGQFATSITNALGHTETRIYDPKFGVVESLTGPNVLTTTWQYDSLGRKTLETRASGNQTTISYAWCEGCITIGQTVSVTDAANTALSITTHYRYDAQGNLTETEDAASNIIAIDYDIHGRKISMNDPDMGSWNCTYNAFGELISQTDANNQTVTITYDKLGRMNSRVEPEGISTWTYDTAPGKSIGKLHHLQSPNGSSRVYEYDNLGRPIKTTHNIDTHSYITQQSSNTVNFIYGADRSRVLKISGTARTRYIGLGAKGGTLFEQTDDGTTTTNLHFIYAAGAQPIAMHQVTEQSNSTTTKTEYFHRDHLGSVEVISDDSGLASTAIYKSHDAWGKRRNADWSDNPEQQFSQINGHLCFTGHESIPEVGLIHMNGRVYDPNLGRFLSADPHVQFTKNTQNYNRYTYVNNNPLKYTDPSGYFLKKAFKKLKKGLKQLGKNIKKYALPIAAAVAGFYTGGIATAVFGNAIAGGAIGGFAAGFIGSGGNFRSGFLGARFAQFVAPGINDLGGDNWSGALARSVASAVSGGIGAELGGGKFKNGAVTAGFARLFNHELNHNQKVSRPNSSTSLIGLGGSFVLGPDGGEVSTGLLLTTGDEFDIGVFWSGGEPHSEIGSLWGLNFNTSTDLFIGVNDGTVFDLIGQSHNLNLVGGPLSATYINYSNGITGLTFGVGPGVPAGFSRTVSTTNAFSYKTVVRSVTDWLCSASGNC